LALSELSMLDFFYVCLTVGSFVALLAYVRFCAWTGRQDPDAVTTERAR
jgi:hypothetical protein